MYAPVRHIVHIARFALDGSGSGLYAASRTTPGESMRLTQGEIRSNAIRFAKEWEDAANERAEAQSFWTDLFGVYGIKRRSVASFEEKVRNLGGNFARIDVFYAGVMLGEHKSRGEDLTRAQSQAFDYVQSLTRAERHSEIPQFIVLSDFETIVVFDLDSDDPAEPVARFPTAKLHENTRHLGFLAGQTTRPIDPEDPINIEAVEILGRLHDALEARGYTGHALERFLVRILFCLFADDTGILDPDAFKAIVKESREDGFGLGALLNQVFDILDTPRDLRSKLPDEFANLPYVNGQLFAERLPAVNFEEPTRAALLEACEFNWSRISPAVFGSLFQSIMAGEEGAKKRRQIGAHYTSERDIMKLIRSLFLDDLEAELAKITTKPKLLEFQAKLGALKFLDPACGCGNFLVVAYRELRRLEIETLEKYHAKRKGEVQQILNLDELLMVNVDQMHGIEIEEWPARIAEVAMWLVDHQMNTKAGEIFGQPVLRLPLTKSAKIVHANALRTDWNEVLSASECSFVLGNPPFVGKKEQNAEQKEDFKRVWGDVKGSGVLDFVTCWHRTAAKYIRGTETAVALVSTNSICQGEQVGVLWPEILDKLGCTIRFAHTTFSWTSEARGKAHVHVVIVGFGAPAERPAIIDYSVDEDHPTVSYVASISPYLFEGDSTTLSKRTRPICRVPEMNYGSMMIDKDRKKPESKGLILTGAEREFVLSQCPDADPFIRRLFGADEYLNGQVRWCLWLVDAPATLVRNCGAIRTHLDDVRAFRLSSSRKQTQELAETPGLFGEIRQPKNQYLIVPKVSSENRPYLPMGFLDAKHIASGSALVIDGASNYDFGILTSAMHMAWLNRVCGRLESRFQYSAQLVYNNFPWPESPTDAQKAAVEQAAQGVLDARARFPDQTLADLYDPLAMPKPLRDAHRALDRAVDRCYRKNPFDSERARVEFLFDLYQKLTAPLTTTKKTARKSGTRRKPA